MEHRPAPGAADARRTPMNPNFLDFEQPIADLQAKIEELRLQTEQMGRSMAEWLRNQYQGDEALMPAVRDLAALPPTYPVAFALAASPTQASVREVLLAYAFGWAENMVQAALKSMQLGQSAGQRILARLAAAIPLAADHAASLMDSERQAFSPMLAILSAQHEVQYSRLFRS